MALSSLTEVVRWPPHENLLQELREWDDNSAQITWSSKTCKLNGFCTNWKFAKKDEASITMREDKISDAEEPMQFHPQKTINPPIAPYEYDKTYFYSLLANSSTPICQITLIPWIGHVIMAGFLCSGTDSILCCWNLYCLIPRWNLCLSWLWALLYVFLSVQVSRIADWLMLCLIDMETCPAAWHSLVLLSTGLILLSFWN